MARVSTKLEVATRTPDGSRSARRLRRTGRVPGVLYGGAGEPVSFDVDARVLRHALAAAGAVLDLSIDGSRATPVVLKDTQRDAVRGHTLHVDLLRVNLNTAIAAVVPVELTGGDDAPGAARDGGVLEQITRELNVEALPSSIPEAIVHDVSGMQINDTVTLDALVPPEGVTLLDDPETVIATLTPPRLQSELDEIESETQVVGEEAPAPDDAQRAEGESPAEGDGSAGSDESGS